MSDEEDFLNRKKEAVGKLREAEEEGEIDKKILPLLKLINNSDDYYTSSSCAGRIVLLQIPSIGDKRNAVFLGKWHRKVSVEEILSTSEKASEGLLWILAQSPIVHVICKELMDADEMVKVGLSCGFKNSGFKSVSGKKVVELCSTERLDMPVGRDGEIFCDREHLSLLVEISNDVMEKGEEKLSRLEEGLKKKF